MWMAYCSATGTPPDTAHAVEPFGDGPELADELVALVEQGVKRATACLVADTDSGDGPSPSQVGDLWLVLDGRGRARCILRTAEIRIGAFDTVDEEFAYDEGEGDRTLRFWRDAHAQYFQRRCDALGIEWNEQLPVVFERFELVWPVSA